MAITSLKYSLFIFYVDELGIGLIERSVFVTLSLHQMDFFLDAPTIIDFSFL